MSQLVVYTNVVRPLRTRVGIGQSNNPELRQRLIIEAIQKTFDESVIYTSSQPVPLPFLRELHDPKYIEFLESAYSSWKQANDPDWAEGDGLVPHEFFHALCRHTPIYKQAGFYGLDTMTPIFEDSYRNALIAAGRAYAAANDWAKEPGDLRYVLLCSPSHHAKTRHYGGYCFINNVIIAAYRYLSLTPDSKVAVLDLDYHAGNGTAQMTADTPALRGRVLACSIHVDPALDYPSNEGYEDDYDPSVCINVVLDGGTKREAYLEALGDVLDRVKKWGATALIIAFGADTYEDDPDATEAGRFKLTLKDYEPMGELIREKLGAIPILVTQEGGYRMEHVPTIVCNFLQSLLL